MARQYNIPGVGYINESGNNDYVIPGSIYVDESAGANSYNQTFTATMTAFAGSSSLATGKHISSTQASMSAGIKIFTAKFVAGMLAFSVSFFKASTKTVSAATVAFVAALSTIVSRVLVILVSMLAMAGSVINTPAKVFTASLSALSASLLGGASLGLSLSASMAAFGASLQNQTTKVFAASSSALTGSLSRITNKSFTASLSAFNNSLSELTVRTLEILATMLAMSGAALKSVSRPISASLSSFSADFTGIISQTVVMSASMASFMAGSIAKTMNKRLHSTTAALSGSIVRAGNKVMVSQLAPFATTIGKAISRTISAIMSALSATLGSIQRTPGPAYFSTAPTFRGRNDDGTESTATYIAPVNTNFQMLADTNFRIRFAISNFGTVHSYIPQLQCSNNGNPWQNVTTQSSIVQASPSQFVQNGSPTTNQFPRPETFAVGLFVATGIPNAPVALFNGQTSELEYCVKIIGSDVNDADQITLSLTGLLSAPPIVPLVTVILNRYSFVQAGVSRILGVSTKTQIGTATITDSADAMVAGGSFQADTFQS